MPALQLTIVVRDTEQVVDQGLGFSLPLTNYKVVHVKAFDREMHECVLLLLHALKALKVYNQERWCAEDLEFLYCLFMELASRAKPSILV